MGPLTCDKPVRHRWGGPIAAAGGAPPDYHPVQAAIGTAFAPHGEVQMAAAVVRDVPELALRADDPGSGATVASGAPAANPGGCGCHADGRGGVLEVMVVGALALRRRRKTEGGK
jgi:MYXO-CTERM domain-containing protein